MLASKVWCQLIDPDPVLVAAGKAYIANTNLAQVAVDEIKRLKDEIERLSYEPLTTRAHECPRCHMKWIDAPKEDHEVPNL